MVGVNRYAAAGEKAIPLLRIDEQVQRVQCENLARVKAQRDQDRRAARARRGAEAPRGTATT